MSEHAQQSPSFDQVLTRHGLRADKQQVLRALDQSLDEALSRHQSAPASPRRSALLERGGFRAATEHESLTVASRAAGDYAALVETALTTTQVAELLRVSESRVRQLTGRHRYSALPGKPRRYPRWQFTDHGVFPNLDFVLPAADELLDPVSLWRFFVNPDPDLVLDGLEISPRDWLAAGADPNRVRGLLAGL